MKISFWLVCTCAFAVLCWRVGYDTGRNDSYNYCPAVQQNERLVYSTQTLHGTVCTYVPHGEYGRATRRRKA